MTKDNKRRWIHNIVILLILFAGCTGCTGCLGRFTDSGIHKDDGFIEASTELTGLTGTAEEKDIGTEVTSDTTSEKTAGSESAAAGSADTLASSELYVHVCGAVKKPDLYCMPQGARAGDAVNMAGGFTDEADTSAVNLAALIEDGQQIYVPAAGQEGRSSDGQNMGNAAKNPAGSRTQSEGSSSPGQEKVNINTAGPEELMTLKGVGQSKADHIISYREEHGTFSSIEEIKNVTGIGEGIYQNIKDSITV